MRFSATILFLMFLFHSDRPKITIWLCGDSTMSVKEQKAYPETGWGMPFVHFWDSTVNIENRAKNGRSTKIFISEKLWQDVIDHVKEGDHVLIQFGHNDEAIEKKERYTTPSEYKANLLKFVNETRNKKAIPVLLTPVSRRRFDSSGTVMETHALYSKIVRDLALEKNVHLIDMDRKSQELLQQFGKENSKWLFLQLQPGEHPNYPDGRNDNTHFNELGARLVAQIVLDEMKKLKLPVTERIIKHIKKL